VINFELNKQQEQEREHEMYNVPASQRRRHSPLRRKRRREHLHDSRHFLFAFALLFLS